MFLFYLNCTRYFQGSPSQKRLCLLLLEYTEVKSNNIFLRFVPSSEFSISWLSKTGILIWVFLKLFIPQEVNIEKALGAPTPIIYLARSSKFVCALPPPPPHCSTLSVPLTSFISTVVLLIGKKVGRIVMI